MTPHYQDATVQLYAGDCLEILGADENGYPYELDYGTRHLIPDSSVDAVVTDPPYGLEFMGRDWDSFGGDNRQPFRGEIQTPDNPFGRSTVRYGGTSSLGGKHVAAMRAFGEWCELWTTECLRVLKPGGHLLAFGGTRTWHRLACAIEDAGFEVRDSIAWLYGSGFPKSLDVSKAIDKAAGAEREVVGQRIAQGGNDTRLGAAHATGALRWGSVHYERIEDMPEAGRAYYADAVERKLDITTPATPAAARWQGWGTALKPAFEPVVVARKPLSGTVASTVLAHGTGALNIDGCRIGDGDGVVTFDRAPRAEDGSVYDLGTVTGVKPSGQGRWPANVVLDESQANALDQMSGELTSGVLAAHHTRNPKDAGILGAYGSADGERGFGDTGGASRFFKVVSSTLDPCPLHGDGSTPAESTSAGRKAGSSAASSLTAGSGSKPTDPSHPATTSTTETTTHSTTRSTTSPSSQPRSTETTTAETARITDSSAESNTDTVHDATPTCLCPSSQFGEQAHSRATAASVSASTSASGVQPTASTPTPTCAPIERLDARFRYTAKADSSERVRVDGVSHPTVKPLDLMRWLVRLVTPPGGVVLEPFAGSGTTVEACILEGFRCIAIEREPDYLPLIVQRINRRRNPVAYYRAAGRAGGDSDTSYGRMKTRECNVCGSRTNPAGGQHSGRPWPACGHDDWSWVEQHESRARSAADQGEDGGLFDLLDEETA